MKLNKASLNLEIGDNDVNSLPILFQDFFMHFFVRGRKQPTQSQLIQMYSVDWTDVYDTYNIEHRTEPVSH